MEPEQGEVWWANMPEPLGWRPVLVLTRPHAVPKLQWVTVAPLTGTIRAIPTEVALPPEDGVPRRCAVTLDNIATIEKDLLARRIAAAARFIYEAQITLERGVAAGLAIRLDQDMAGAVVVLEAAEQAVAYYEAPAFDFVEKRRTPLPIGPPVNLRVVNRLEHVAIYVNDDLRLAFSRYRGLGREVGLFVDRARATFENLRLRSLQVDNPT